MFNANLFEPCSPASVGDGIPLIDGQFDFRVSCFSVSDLNSSMPFGVLGTIFFGEFDPGSGRTLAACLTHASRTMKPSLLGGLVANG
jgi:hypothetical protein